jgi:hypothetical protein
MSRPGGETVSDRAPLLVVPEICFREHRSGNTRAGK